MDVDLCGGSFLESIIEDCRCLVSCFDVAIFSFVCRTFNAIVDSLEKVSLFVGFRIWIEEAPEGIISVDCMGHEQMTAFVISTMYIVIL